MWQYEKPEWLFSEDLQREFRMGKTKTYLVFNQLPGVVRIGKRKAIKRSTLEMHLAQHGALDAKWPKRRRRGAARW